MGYIDVHIHILPGVDDGSKDSTTTKEMLRIAAGEGVTRMIATPHYKKGRCGMSADTIYEMCEEWNRWCEDQSLGITLYPGTEVLYHDELEDKIDSGWLCGMNETEYLLVEFQPFESFAYIRNALDDIFALGMRPVLAHVERYECMLKSVDNARLLYEMGVVLQANAGSITGKYGRECKKFLKKCLKEELISIVGTDAHNAEGRAPLMRECGEYLTKKYGREYARELMHDNAVALFAL